MTTTEQTKLGDGQPKPAGTWDYYGKLDPQNEARPYKEAELQARYGDRYVPFSTFSVGVFEWLPKSSGKGTKKGKTIKRFSGPVSDPQSVYDKAIEFINELQW